jgi:hypothetical protein
MKTIRNKLYSVIALAGFALMPHAHAVNPPPDGGYPGGNTAEGQAALSSLTTGGFNTATGFLSLRSDTSGSFNTAVGAGALLANTADSNTATGAGALLSNTTAVANTAYGAFALLSNTTGGTPGTIFGIDVGPNTAVGSRALQSNTTTSANTAVGYQALGNLTGGFMGTDLAAHTAVGFQALGNATGGYGNCAVGWRALYSNTDMSINTGIGFDALSSNTGGCCNVAIGAEALRSNTTSSNNVAVGTGAGMNMTGHDNIAVGYGAGQNISGDNNVVIGSGGFDASTTIQIGERGLHTATFIAGIHDATISGTGVVVNDAGQLGVTASAARFKEEIKPMDAASETLFLLRPVTFRYKKEIDPAGTPQFGLVAEDVEKVNPDLVVRDKEGKPYTVRYDQVHAMLLNEFLKEHRKLEEQQTTIGQLTSNATKQEATISQLKEAVEVLSTQLKEQAAQIQN